MYNSQLVELLKTLSVYELNRLEKFVASPFFNMNEEITALFRILKKYNPKYEHKNMSKEKVFKAIFPEQKYDDKRLRYLSSGLLKLAVEYLGQLNLKQDIFGTNIYSIKELIERKQIKIAEKRIAEAGKNLAPSNYPNEVYYYNRHLLKSQSNYLALTQNKTLNPDDLVQEGENIILLLFVVLMQTTYNLSVMENTYNLNNPNNIIIDFLSTINIDKFIQKASQSKFSNAKIYELYHNMMLLKREPQNDEPFYKLKSFLKYYLEILNKQDQYNLFMALESFCAYRILKGDSNFKKEKFELLKQSLRYNIFSPSQSGFFPTADFRNFVIEGVDAGEFEWTEEFVKNYIDKVDAKQKENIFNLSYATINFGKKKYDLAIENLSRITTGNVFFKYDIKSFMLKIYYEMNLIEPAYELIDSYRHFLKTNASLSKRRKDSVLNFIKFTNLLLKMKNGDNSISHDLLKKDIAETAWITNKEWLLEKFDELSKQVSQQSKK
jgi:hypothetical protein